VGNIKVFGSRKTSGIYLIKVNLPETCSYTPISVAALPKAWVCDRSLAAIAGSNPAGAWLPVSCVCCQVEICASG
jgi:hypothetical protein